VAHVPKGYVYTLSDPAGGGPRYVGATVDPRARFWQHAEKGNKGIGALGKWFGSVRRSGREPVMDIIFEGEWADSFRVEAMMYDTLAAQGAALLNLGRPSGRPGGR